MSIAAALTVVVSAPKQQLVADLKAVGASVGELNRVLKSTFQDQSAIEQYRRKLELLSLAAKANEISARQWADGMAKLTQEMRQQELAASADVYDKRIAQRKAAMQAEVAYRQELRATFAAEQQRAAEQANRSATGAVGGQGATASAAIRAGIEGRLANDRYLNGVRYRANMEAAEQERSNTNFLTQLRYRSAMEATTQDRSNTNYLARLRYRSTMEASEQQRSNTNYLTQLRYRATMEANEQQRNTARYLSQLRYNSLMAATTARNEAAAAAEATLNAQRARGQALMANISPQVRLNQAMAEYRALLASTAITQAEFNQLQRAAQREFYLTATLMGRTFGRMGQALSAVGLYNPWLLVVGAIAGAVHETAHFSNNLAMVKAISSLTADDMARLASEAQRMGSTSVFSATQAAEAMKYLAQAGLDVNQILDATPAVLNLATAGEMDLANATEIAVRIMGAFHMRADQLNEVVDALAVGANKSLASVESLGEAMKFVGPVAYQAGVDLDSTTAALMVLHDQGIVGEMAGTGLRNMLVRLASPTNDAADAFAQMVMEVRTFEDGSLDLVATLVDMHDALEGLGDVERLKILSQIGKTRTAAMFSAMIADPKALLAALDEVHNKAGAGRKMAEEATAGLGKQWQMAWNEIKNAGLDLVAVLGEGPFGLAHLVKLIAQAFEGVFAILRAVVDVAKMVLFGFVGIVATIANMLLMLANISTLGIFHLQALEDMAGELADYAFKELRDSATDAADALGKFANRVADDGKPAGAVRAPMTAGAKALVADIDKKIAAAETAIFVARSGLPKLFGRDTDADINVLSKAIAEMQKQKYAILAQGESAARAAAMPNQFLLSEEDQKRQEDAEKMLDELMEQNTYARLNNDEKKLALIYEAEMDGLIAAGSTGLAESLVQQIAIREEIEKRRTALADANKDVEKDIASEQVKLDIFKQFGREADKYDQLLADLAAHNTDLDAAAVARLKHESEIYRKLVEQNKVIRDRKHNLESLKDKARSTIESVDPAEAFYKAYAELVAEQAAGGFKGNEKAFFTKRGELEKQFLQASGAFSSTNPAVARGSEEEFKILHAGDNPLINIQRKQLSVMEHSDATLGTVRDLLKNTGVVIAALPD